MGVGTVEAPGDTDGVGVDGGRTGAVGQLASAGLNAVGLGAALNAVGDGLCAGVGSGVGVTTNGV